ncbi:TonB-dependent receptor [Olivibacter ginsenosidimutans]|uniref:TonB-dependent receptor n=1 Tax=Olivibacter ginsenosidimutans TaxID=1176537 RepID=A0ABP9AVP0_9SPHI
MRAYARWFGLLCSLLIFHHSIAIAQSTLKGLVVDENNRPLPHASVKLKGIGYEVRTDENGRYQVDRSVMGADSCILIFSYMGKQTVERALTFPITTLPVVKLQNTSLGLDEIEITAQSTGGSTNSSLVINREMLERYPSLSLNDLLNFLPNRKITPPSLQEMQNATLRSAFERTLNGSRHVQELNNSFGVAIIVDDIAQSNNSNMQSLNPGITGLGAAHVGINGSQYNLQGNNVSNQMKYSGESTFGGIDLRQIPTENIEKIEVITGVPSVRYGDLTSGAIIVERQAGKSPAYFRMQLRDNATSYGFSDGFNLGKKIGDINYNISYVNSFADNRDKIKQYNRINGSLIWTTRFGKQERLKHTLSATYGRHIDGVKRDEDDPQSPMVKFNNWNLNLSSRWSYQTNGNFFKRFALNLGYSTSHQETYRETSVNSAFVLYTDATQTGIVEGTYDAGIYRAVDHIDGRPLNLTARLESYALWKTGAIQHTLNIGTTADYSANNGKGRLSDPARPRQNLGSNSERYYDFHLAVAAKDVGAYIEDHFKVAIAQRPLSITAGARWDSQNGYSSFSPRTNLNYRWNDNLQFGLAYGLAFKAPGLAHRYPGPVFTELVLLNAYNGKVNESTSRIYVDRYDPPSDHLKPSQSQTIEFTARWQKDGHRLAFNLYHRTNKNGINSYTNYVYPQLPVYTAIAQTGQKPIVEQTGTVVKEIQHSMLANVLRSTDNGFEVMYSSPRVAAIATSFNASGGLYRTVSCSNMVSPENITNTGTDPNDIVRGYYLPSSSLSYSSNGRIGSATHLPRLKLIFEFTADFQLMNYSKQKDYSFQPIAYMTRDFTYYAIDHYDASNPDHKLLYDLRVKDYTEDNISRNLFAANFHFSVAKEINERLRISFNVYNFLDYQPRIYREKLTSKVLTPNSKPNFGAEISFKL